MATTFGYLQHLVEFDDLGLGVGAEVVALAGQQLVLEDGLHMVRRFVHEQGRSLTRFELVDVIGARLQADVVAEADGQV
ncbi:hypothetical protein D3C73_1459800 [compost metagenome]